MASFARYRIQSPPKKCLYVTGLLAALAFCSTAPADQVVHEKLLPSTACVVAKHGEKYVTGSGVVVDAQRRWILTNYHIVGDGDEAGVFFPLREKGRLMQDVQYYLPKLEKMGIKGRIVARDPKKDLAIIELERLPEEVQAVKLAESSAQPGQWVHMVGNQESTGSLWSYSYGKVRSLVRRKMNFPSAGVNVDLDADCLISSLNGNVGDSGGPVVNDQGELVALYSHQYINVRLVSGSIDIGEIRAFLERSRNDLLVGQTPTNTAREIPLAPRPQ